MVHLNEDSGVVDYIKSKLKENDGYCPCRLKRTEDTKCMCAEFRAQIKDDSFHGECHCGLYVKD